MCVDQSVFRGFFLRASTHGVKGVRCVHAVAFRGGFCVETSTYAGSIGWVYVAWVIDYDVMMT